MNDALARIDTVATEAMALFVRAARDVPPQVWDQPSNLAGWSVRDLVGHATGSAAKIVSLIEGGSFGPPSEPADWVCDDPVGRLRELADRLRAVLPGADLEAPRQSPRGEVPLRRALSFPVSDLALHSWDLYRSHGQALELSDELLVFCRALVDSVPEAQLRRPGGFGPAQPAPGGSTPTVRLMARLGRSVQGGA